MITDFFDPFQARSYKIRLDGPFFIFLKKKRKERGGREISIAQRILPKWISLELP